jgi:hypothetical protein
MPLMSRKPVRRSQAISPFGVGSIVNFPGPVSLIHAGLDAWDYNENDSHHHEFRISDDRRLAERLRVEYFVEPPDYRKPIRNSATQPPNLKLTLPFLRFPLWHVCPRCSRMYLAKPHDFAPPECRGPIGTGSQRGESHNPRKTLPVRFIAACANGHLQDFPWVDWILSNNSSAVDGGWRPNNRDKWLRMQATDSLSISGLRVGAEELDANGKIREVIKKKPMHGVFSQDENNGFFLSRLGIDCSSNNPALPTSNDLVKNNNACKEPLRVLLTGATNLYFPIVASSIYIPEISKQVRDQEILDLLDDFQMASEFETQIIKDGLIDERTVRILVRKYRPDLTIDHKSLAEAINEILPERIFFREARVLEFLKQKIRASRSKELTTEMVKKVLDTYFEDWAISLDYLVSVIRQSERLAGVLKTSEASGDDEEKVESLDSILEDHRFEEYEVFCRDISEGQMPKLNLLIRSHDISSYSEEIGRYLDRVSLLHKLRETRVFMGFSRIHPPDSGSGIQWNLISSERKRWLPGTVVRGEGIFLKFRDDVIDNWALKSGMYHAHRLYPVNLSSNRFREERGQHAELKTPSFVLLHTLAHLLINELVYECGYGSSSLRERIYSSDREGRRMNGLMIYTAAGDTDGSMGGLVEMGRPGKLERVIETALERARWCSSDPVCIESHGQGPGSCNLAACHSCALLPETACEHMNRFLDRGTVIGTLDESSSGFF